MYMYTVCWIEWTCDIVQPLFSKRPCLENGSEEKDNDPDDVTAAKITHLAARHFVQVLQQSYMYVKQGLSDACRAAQDACADEAFRIAASE